VSPHCRPVKGGVTRLLHRGGRTSWASQSAGDTTKRIMLTWEMCRRVEGMEHNWSEKNILGNDSRKKGYRVGAEMPRIWD